eukprot:bmy_07200T0
MGFWKFPPFLVLSIPVLNQAAMLQAAPFRWALENGFDPATLTSKEMRLLLAAMMNDYVQMKARELKQETGGLQVPSPYSNLLHDCLQGQPWCMVLSSLTFPCSLDSSRIKQCNNLSTCVLGTYT